MDTNNPSSLTLNPHNPTPASNESALTTQQSKINSDPQTSIASLAPVSSSSSNPNEAASKLVEAIDEFLGDIEKKFKGISEEILGKLDEMAERCDRLEQEMTTRETDQMGIEVTPSVTGESTS